MADFRFPNNSQRTAIVGRTGSGKTQFAAWLLSHADFISQPFVIIDFKGDDLLNAIPYLKPISLNDMPSEAGLYIVRPNPATDGAAVEDFLMRIWAKEHIGVFIDESYMIEKDSPALSACLTQGRSKRIPMICLTQRPAWISRFVFSESDFFAIFHLNDKRDQKTVEQFMPASIEERLPDFNCRWFDVGQNEIFRLLPVPDRDTILLRFEEKLALLNSEKRAENKAKTKFI